MINQDVNIYGKKQFQPNKQPQEKEYPYPKHLHNLNLDMMKSFKKSFDILDTGKQSKMDTKEFLAEMKRLKLDKECPSLFEIVVQMKEKYQKIIFEDMLEFFNDKLGKSHKKRYDTDKIFELIDIKQDGQIDVKDVVQISKELNLEWTEEEVRDMMYKINDETETIDRDLFYQIMKKFVY